MSQIKAFNDLRFKDFIFEKMSHKNADKSISSHPFLFECNNYALPACLRKKLIICFEIYWLSDLKTDKKS